LLGRLWFLHDLTDFKRIETALVENEIRYRSLFSQANDAIMLVHDGLFVDCNEKAETMFGLPMGSIIGNSPAKLSPVMQPDGSISSNVVKKHISDVLAGMPQHFYWQHLRADGRTFEAEVSLNRIEIGDQVYVQALVRDITERLRTENALRASERKNKALLDGIPDLILRLKADGEILDLKRSDQQELFKVQSEVVGENLQTYMPPIMAEALLDAAQTVVAKGESLQFETELPTGEGTQDFETRLVKSGPDEVMAIIRDVTTRKRTEKELIKRNFELDSFVYRASHDLKAPLNSLMGIINLLESESEEPVVLSYLKMMNKSVVKLDTFIRDLADFSRNARTELEQAEISWKQLVDETLENLQFADNSERIAKNIKIDQEGPFFSDPIRLGIVFNNLISNAIKYQNLDRKDALVDVIIVSREDYATIVIADNGIGIAQEHQAKVYNLFFRASIQSYGSGMGMYIVKNAIERLKGEISMTSVEGQGTTFSIMLPNLLKD
jgi:PAS domain S-box-containing protein